MLSARLRRAGLRLVQRTPDPSSESARIVSAIPPLHGEPEHELEYIKELITLCTDDVRQVTTYISVSFVVTALVINGVFSEDLGDQETWIRASFAVSVAALGAAALCFFRYARQLHKTRMALTRCIPSLATARARELWAGEAGVWHVHGRAYVLGLYLVGLGLCLQLIVVVVTVLQGTGPG